MDLKCNIFDRWKGGVGGCGWGEEGIELEFSLLCIFVYIVFSVCVEVSCFFCLYKKEKIKYNFND